LSCLSNALATLSICRVDPMIAGAKTIDKPRPEQPSSGWRSFGTAHDCLSLQGPSFTSGQAPDMAASKDPNDPLAKGHAEAFETQVIRIGPCLATKICPLTALQQAIQQILRPVSRSGKPESTLLDKKRWRQGTLSRLLRVRWSYSRNQGRSICRSLWQIGPHLTPTPDYYTDKTFQSLQRLQKTMGMLNSAHERAHGSTLPELTPPSSSKRDEPAAGSSNPDPSHRRLSVHSATCIMKR
jgi:hypothetical protein